MHIPFSEALLEPDEHFNTPEEILNNNNYTGEEKLRLLEQWKNDIKELLTADEENMLRTNNNGRNILDLMEAINKAIDSIQN